VQVPQFVRCDDRHLPCQRNRVLHLCDETTYGILKGYDVPKETYEWAQRANIVIDKQGVIQHIEEADSAVDPDSAV
jgi:peroxiredoxin